MSYPWENCPQGPFCHFFSCFIICINRSILCMGQIMQSIIMSDMDGQNLNESRFLVEEVNLDEQPTEEEVLQRAQQLQIDDLLLAKESLTKQLDPQWKPYCNRYGDIYYINLLEKKAYLDHPIDMYYKKLDCKNNGIPSPRYRSYSFEQISQSLDLIQRQIRNFNSIGTTLRVVYEEPSQQQLSSHPRSPQNAQIFDIKQPEQSPFHSDSQSNANIHQQFNSEEMAEILAYQSQLEEHYELQLIQHKQNMGKKLVLLQKQQKQKQQRIINRKISEAKQLYKIQVRLKNQLDYERQKKKLQEQMQKKIQYYYQNMHKFNTVFEDLRQRQRNVDSLHREIQILHKISVSGQIQCDKQLNKAKNNEKLKSNLLKDYDQKTMEIVGGCAAYQQMLQQQIDNIFVGDEEVNKKWMKCVQDKVEKGDIECSLISNQVKNTNENKRQYIQKESCRSRRRPNIFTKPVTKIENQTFYQQLEKQINDQQIWSTKTDTVDIKPHYSHFPKSRNGLNMMRLRMKII